MSRLSSSHSHRRRTRQGHGLPASPISGTIPAAGSTTNSATAFAIDAGHGTSMTPSQAMKGSFATSRNLLTDRTNNAALAFPAIERHDAAANAIDAALPSRRRAVLRQAHRDLRTLTNDLGEALDQTEARLETLRRTPRTLRTTDNARSLDQLERELTAARQDVVVLSDATERLSRRLRPRWHHLGAADLLAPIVAAARARARPRGITITVRATPNLPRLFGDLALLEPLIERALDGVLASLDAGQRLEIRLSTRGIGADERLLITFRDHGPTLSTESLAAVRLAIAAAQTATAGAMGPLVPLSVIEALTPETLADLTIDSSPDQGNRLTIGLPIATGASALSAWRTWAETVSCVESSRSAEAWLVRRAVVTWSTADATGVPGFRSDSSASIAATERAVRRLNRHEQIVRTVPPGSFVWYVGGDRWCVACLSTAARWRRRLDRLTASSVREPVSARLLSVGADLVRWNPSVGRPVSGIRPVVDSLLGVPMADLPALATWLDEMTTTGRRQA